MFGLGLWEIGVVVMLAVMLFPPKELPKLARTIARTYGSIRRTAEDFRSQIMEDEDLRAPIDEVRSAYNDARWQLKKAEAAARRELQKAEMETRKAAEQAKAAVKDHDETPALAADDREDDHDDQDDQSAEQGDTYGNEHLDPATLVAPDPELAPEPELAGDRVPAAAPRAFVPPPPVMTEQGASDEADEATSPSDAAKRESSVA